MKTAFTISILSGLVAVTSCIPKRGSKYGEGGAAVLKSVTINQPDLKKEMKSAITDADKQKVYDSLVYQLTIVAKQKDAKDDCDAGITATKFDSGITALASSTFGDLKVKKGCNYQISMKIGAKSDDGKAIKTNYLMSWDDKDPAVLAKEELEKDKPAVSVKLYVTDAGKQYWDADSIVTPTDSNTDINVGLSRSFKLVASSFTEEIDTKNNKAVGSVELTPDVAPTKDMVCAVVMKATLAVSGGESPSDQKALLFAAGDSTKAIVKFPAGSVAKVVIKDFSRALATPNVFTVARQSEVYAYCFAEENSATSKLNECFPQAVTPAVPVANMPVAACNGVNALKNPTDG